MRREGGVPWRLIHDAFEFGLIAKGLFALVELSLGIGLAAIGTDTISGWVHALTAHEISQDPTDPVARFLLGKAEAMTYSTQHFYAYYLASHGALKLGMVALLFRRVLWAYPATIVVLMGFVAYQVWLISAGPTAGLVLITLVDIAVIGLTILEYQRLRRIG